MALYILVAQVALAAGQLAFGAIGSAGPLSFGLAAALYALAILPGLGVSFVNLGTPAHRVLPRSSPFAGGTAIGFVGVIVSGVFVGSWLGLGSVFALERLGSVRLGSLYLAVMIAGGALSQWPFGRLAERVPREHILRVACGLSALLVVALAFTNGLAVTMMIGFWLGALGFALYPLAVGVVQDRVDDTQRLSTAAVCLLAYSVGAVLGPLAISVVEPFVGRDGLLYATFVASLLVVAARSSSRLPEPASVATGDPPVALSEERGSATAF
jgi:MFS family permease